MVLFLNYKKLIFFSSKMQITVLLLLKGGETMSIELMITLVGFLSSIFSILFAYLAFKRSDRKEHKDEGKSEGVMFSDIGYIKACVDRVEKNLCTVDERYRNIAERLARVEESLSNLKLRVDEIV